MKLRGIDFGYVLDASGVRGWFGEGHSYHRLMPRWFNFAGSTFVAKTTTLERRDPYGALARDGRTIRVLRQPTVSVHFWKGVVLNALSLPGPGLEALLADGRWQQRQEPFFLSFRPLAETPQGRVNEASRAVALLKVALPGFAGPVGLQVNWSCPNVPAGAPHRAPTGDGIAGFSAALDAYGELDVPVMVKLSVTDPVEDARAIAEHPACDALCVSNTVPWGELPDRIDWAGLFGAQSPLERYGGGGLSGAPLLPLVAEWVAEARRQGVTKPINAGGGILGPADAAALQQAGASSIFVGSIAILRGWRLAPTIRRANRVFADAAAHAPHPTAAVDQVAEAPPAAPRASLAVTAVEQVAEAPRAAPHAPRSTAAVAPVAEAPPASPAHVPADRGGASPAGAGGV